MRTSEINRNTRETKVSLKLNIDGSGRAEIDTGVGFLDHMLNLFARHSRMDLAVTASGDNYIDDHHTVEDVGIVMGQAFAEALADKRGIVRYGSCILPMDEALIMTAVDISGRSYLAYELVIPTEKAGSFDTELVEEFWLAFTRNAGITLHINELAGSNSHHIIEGAFKSAARSLRQAVSIDADFSDEIPSTKGLL